MFEGVDESLYQENAQIDGKAAHATIDNESYTGKASIQGLIISYDIASNKLRTSFAKDLEKYGYRLQYSVREIDNSERVLNNIKSIIENKYKRKFGEEDSVYILKLSKSCQITTYGYAKH